MKIGISSARTAREVSPQSFSILAVLALVVFALPVPAQTRDASGSAAIATYVGADRMQRLVEGAKKERTVTVYTSAPVDDMAVLIAAFEKKYAVKVRLWRASSENVLQRALAEDRAGRFEADLFETNGPELESLHREKLLQEVKSAHLSDLIPVAILPHREWIATRLNIFSGAYNTKLVKKDDLPHSYGDLLSPKWKGKLGVEAEDLDWFAGVVDELGEANGVKLFRDIVAANGVSVRKGHTLLTNLVASGEVPVALTVYNYKVQQLKNRGAPIDWFVIPPAIARPNGVGLARRAPHPNSGVLFFEFMLSDAQELLLKRDYVPTSRKIVTSLNKIPLKFVDPRVVLDEHAKWAKLYEETFGNRARQ